MTKNYYSGGYYMTISNEPSMTNSGNTYCMFDLVKDRNNFWGCPVNQFGTIEEVLNTLKIWKGISDKQENEYLRELGADRIKMEIEFINILENELSECVIQ